MDYDQADMLLNAFGRIVERADTHNKLIAEQNQLVAAQTEAIKAQTASNDACAKALYQAINSLAAKH